jgi:FAD/FMN-containing dehydrogenase
MTRQSATVITNFGGNVQFRPKYLYAPRTEAELLDILDRHGTGTIRVFGAKHSWNSGLASDDVSVDLRHFNRVETTTDVEGQTWATVGGGCPLKVLLRKLRVQADVTLPTLGLITEQTIAGAISTGTHGSGRHSISHYMEEIRVAAYDPDTGNAVIRSYTEGPELRAARCAIGCLGIIVSVRFACIRRYVIAERMGPRADLDEILDRVEEFPLQQF